METVRVKIKNFYEYFFKAYQGKKLVFFLKMCVSRAIWLKILVLKKYLGSKSEIEFIGGISGPKVFYYYFF